MNNVIDTILREKKITDLLESRGIFPIKEYPDRFAYRCPLHGEDKDPSFMVFKNEGQQTYHCFGCHSKVDVINLLCELDKISTKKAIRILLEGLDVEIGTTTDWLVEQALIEHGAISSSVDLEKIMLEIGFLCRSHLQIHQDEEEIGFFDKVFAQVDYRARAGDKEILMGMRDILRKKGIPIRVDVCHNRKEQRILSDTRRKDTVWKK